MLKVGLTGGIGSGKTIVGQIFERLGIPVFNADLEAKKITNTDLQIIQALKTEFGNDIYIKQEIDRRKLASIIFDDKDALKKVNAIIHPKVHAYFMDWCKNQDTPYVIEEAAILFESGANNHMDLVINVHADELLRINRVVKRDHVTADMVKERMKNQLNDGERIHLADFTIYNDGKKMILPQILEIHKNILNQAK
jgi:dephospho-CoA kinase